MRVTSCKIALAPACFALASMPGMALSQNSEDEQVAIASLPDRAGTDDGDLTITVYGRALEQIGVAQTGSQGTVGYADFENVPISRTGELVENVPGVIATQHSGNLPNRFFFRQRSQ